MQALTPSVVSRGTAAPVKPAAPPPPLVEKDTSWVAGRDLVPQTPSEHSLRAFCQAMPKVDLHRHMEGAITAEMMLRIADKYGIQLPTRNLEELRPLMQVTDKDKTLIDFIKKFDTIGLAFKNTDAVREITAQTILDASQDNVKYLELRFSPLYIAEQYHLDPKDVMQAVADGVKEASKQCDTKTNLIAIVEREMPVEKAWQVEKLAEAFKDQGVVAMDLANDEYDYPPGPFAAVFQAAHKAGLHVTVHAGEAGPAANVKTSIDQLDAERVGHGVQTAGDPSVEQEVLQKHIGLEMCPTSNEETHAADGLGQYPMRRYYNEGADVSVNTDDPAVCGVTQSGEYYKVVHNLGFSIPELQKMDLNAVNSAFISDADKQALAAQFQQSFDQLNAVAAQHPEMAQWYQPHQALPGGV